MAASGKQMALGQLGQEAICPLCLDFFEHPMVLSCGHNFCRDCLAQLGTEFSCPQCRAKVEPGSACPNWALANIVGHLKRLQLSDGAHEECSSHRLCQEHGLPLEVFCSSEKSFLCPNCFRGHQGHCVLTLPDAAQEYKGLLDALLEPLRKEWQKLLEQRQAEEQSRKKCQEQFATEKQKVVLLLEPLQELLRERQQLWLAWLADQEEKMEADWGIPLAQLSGEASRLQQLIAQTERKCRQPDREFLQGIQDTVDRCRSYVVGRVESVSPRLQSRVQTLLEKNDSLRQIVDNYKASLQKTLEDLERLLATGALPQVPHTPSLSKADAPKKPKPRKVFVTFNVFTAHPKLWCQENRVSWARRYQKRPNVPERFDKEFCVLGCEGFRGRQVWWEVSVNESLKEACHEFFDWDKPRWAIGVAKDSIPRKRNFQLSPQEGIWAVGTYNGYEIVAFSTVQQNLNLERMAQKLQVRLNYEAEKVEFLDGDTEISLYTFQMGPLYGETLRPFFYLAHNGITLQCQQHPHHHPRPRLL